MHYGIYKNARNASWQCLIDYNIKALPIKVIDIAKRSNITVLKYSDVNKNRLQYNESGATFFEKNRIYIVYRNSSTLEHCRFTVAHELGHIFLGHPLTMNGSFYRKFNITKPEIEQAADIFASRLLAPACVLWGLNLHTAEEIAEVCNISLPAAKIRAERMELLYKRNKFLISPLEKQVFDNFSDYITKFNNRKK